MFNSICISNSKVSVSFFLGTHSLNYSLYYTKEAWSCKYIHKTDRLPTFKTF